MNRSARRYIAFLLTILYAVSVALVGVAHRPMSASAASQDSALAAYALPDGSLPVLCLADRGAHEKGGTHHDKRFACDSCRLVTAAGLVVLVALAFDVLSSDLGLVITGEPPALSDGNRPADLRSRAPPALA